MGHIGDGHEASVGVTGKTGDVIIAAVQPLERVALEPGRGILDAGMVIDADLGKPRKQLFVFTINTLSDHVEYFLAIANEVLGENEVKVIQPLDVVVSKGLAEWIFTVDETPREGLDSGVIMNEQIGINIAIRLPKVRVNLEAQIAENLISGHGVLAHFEHIGGHQGL